VIRINQLKIRPDESEEKLSGQILQALEIKKSDLLQWRTAKKSIDARGSQVWFVYTVDVRIKNEERVLNKNKKKSIQKKEESPPVKRPTYRLAQQPIIIGAGPAGLFCALVLAEQGARPIIVERGKRVSDRIKDIQKFWQESILDPESNIQFGEGGAGTFSDGKLTTLIKDKEGHGRYVLDQMIEAGAPKEISYLNKPHIGTDRLRSVMVRIREKIISFGGVFLFEEKLLDIQCEDNRIRGIVTSKGIYKSGVVVLGIGHSARDTFQILNDHIEIVPKPFSVGVRIEHLREEIDRWQYGSAVEKYALPAADYKLVHHCKNGRSVYTFCMCPGGVVTGASSQIGGVVTNGMSYYKRDLTNSNSAVLVNVTPADFPSKHPLAGMVFQKELEEKAYEAGGGLYHAPVQLFEDFVSGQSSSRFGRIRPTYQPGTNFFDLNKLLPEYVSQGLKEGIQAFGTRIKGFDAPDSLMTAVETRSSSPVRLVRDENRMTSIKGLYAIGEGSGYAGGIMSSAIDGVKAAEGILEGNS
jgi:hypothetical protein